MTSYKIALMMGLIIYFQELNYNVSQKNKYWQKYLLLQLYIDLWRRDGE
jgi:cell shape-determining protein MreD